MDKIEFQNSIEQLTQLFLSDPRDFTRVLNQLRSNHHFSVQQDIKLQLMEIHKKWREGKHDYALNTLDELLQKILDHQYTELSIEAYTLLSQFKMEIAQYDQVLEIAEEVLPLLDKNNNIQNYADILNQMVLSYHNLGQFNTSIEIAHDLIEFLTSHPRQDYQLSRIHNNLGNNYEIIGNIKKAEKYYRTANRYCRNIGFKRGISITLNNLGDVATAQGYYSKAKEYYIEGIKVAKQIADEKTFGLLLKNYAKLLLDKGELPESHRLIQKSIALLKKNKYYNQLIAANELYSQYYYIIGKYDKALDCLEEATQLSQKYNIKQDHILILIQYAEIWRLLGQKELSYQYLKHAHELSLKINSDLFYAHVLVQKAKLNLSDRLFFEADFALEQALTIAKRLNHFDIKFHAQLMLAQNHFIRYYQMRDQQGFDNALSIITKLSRFTKQQHLIPRYLSVQIILGLLHILNKDYDLGQDIFNTALIKAQELELGNKLNIIKTCLNLIRGIPFVNQSKTQQSEELFLTLLLDQFSDTAESTPAIDPEQTSMDALSVVVYKVDEKEGMVVHEKLNLELKDRSMEMNIMYCGNLYATLLGQGHNYHEGLFGPLPFGTSDFRAIVYAKRIVNDLVPRNNRSYSNYFLFTLIFPRNLTRYFSNRILLSPLLKIEIDTIKSPSEITHSWLKDFKEKIVFNIHHSE